MHKCEIDARKRTRTRMEKEEQATPLIDVVHVSCPIEGGLNSSSRCLVEGLNELFTSVDLGVKLH